MNETMFDELLASAREGGAILRGEALPARTLVVDSPVMSSQVVYEERHGIRVHGVSRRRVG